MVARRRLRTLEVEKEIDVMSRNTSPFLFGASKKNDKVEKEVKNDLLEKLKTIDPYY